MSSVLVSEALQTASMTGHFTLRALCDAISLSPSEPQLRKKVWRALAPNATEHITESGTYCWQIGPDARRDALRGFYALPQLDRFLEQVPPALKGDKQSEPDRFGKALQTILRRERIKLDDPPGNAGSDRLRDALSEAAAFLDAVQFAQVVPALKTEDLQVKLHRNRPYAPISLAQFKNLTEAKIKQLQARCDIRTVLPARHFGYSTQRRTISRFVRGVSSKTSPLLLTGVAGAGKSALLSRLILGWQRTQPDMIVVSLDFDRRQLNAGEPIELMQEFFRQIIAALELRDHKPDDPLLQGLRQIRDDISLFKTSSTDGSRETNDQQASDIRSVLRMLSSDWAKPLRDTRIAVVMDTFEAIDRMAAYDRLAGIADDGLLPENVVVTQIMKLFGDVQETSLGKMRLVVSGREEPLTRTGQQALFGTRLRLRGLSSISGANLLQAIAANHDTATVSIFEDGEKSRLISSLLDGHPLALIAFVRYANDNRSDVDDLIVDLQTRGGFQAEFAQVFLYRRILDRITDEAVRKLAHPGLMLRRLDADAIQFILAQACLDRGPASGNAMTPHEAQNLFDRLRNQYWLVEQIDGQADKVRHIPDLRRLMLDGLLSGPSEDDKDDVRAKKEDLRRRALDVCRLAAAHYGPSDDVGKQLDAMYYGAFNDPVPGDMTKDIATQLDRHLGSDIDTMPIGWRARIKFLLGRENSTAEIETLDDIEQQEALRRGFDLAQKAGFTTKARSGLRQTGSAPAPKPTVAPPTERAEGTGDLDLPSPSVSGTTATASAPLSLADRGKAVQMAWETGDLAPLFDGIESGKEGPISQLIKAVADASEEEQVEFCLPAERSLFDHPLHIAALVALPHVMPSRPQFAPPEPHLDNSISRCLPRVVQFLFDGDRDAAVSVLRQCAALGADAMPIAHNRAVGGDVMAALADRFDGKPPPDISYSGMSLLAGAPADELGRLSLEKISPQNFFYGPLEKLYATAAQDDLSLPMVERVYRSFLQERLDEKMIMALGPDEREMFKKMFRGLTPELYGPVSAILGRLDFHAGEEITLSISSRHPMWPSDLRFDDQFLYNAEQAPTIVETADRGGVLVDLIDLLGKHDDHIGRLANIHSLVTGIYFADDRDPNFPA